MMTLENASICAMRTIPNQLEIATSLTYCSTGRQSIEDDGAREGEKTLLVSCFSGVTYAVELAE